VAKSKKKPAQAGADAGTTASERRATLDKLRAEERSKARRRTALMVAPALVLAVIVGVMVALQFKQASKPGGALASIGVAASAAGCQDVVVKKAEGNQDHRPEGEAVDYADNPPANGPHWGQFLFGGQVRKFWTPEDRPPVERLVHSLEHGYTILWYDPTIAKDDEQLEQLEEIADQFSGSALEDKFMAAPWTEADAEDRDSDFPEGTHLALTHWSMGGTQGNPEGQLGVWQYCGKVSGAAVSTFMEDYPYSDSPEPRAG
jgi:hypothetical protein